MNTTDRDKPDLEGYDLITDLTERLTSSSYSLIADILFPLADWIELAVNAGNAKDVPCVIREIAEICRTRGEE